MRCNRIRGGGELSIVVALLVAAALAFGAAGCAPSWIGTNERAVLRVDDTCLLVRYSAHDLTYESSIIPRSWIQRSSHAGAITYPEEFVATFVADTGERLELRARQPGQ